MPKGCRRQQAATSSPEEQRLAKSVAIEVPDDADVSDVVNEVPPMRRYPAVIDDEVEEAAFSGGYLRRRLDRAFG
jgi:hypothetical protein